jgi:hypothetical protein
MVNQHIKASERTRFARSTREAFGVYYPITRRVSWGDRFVGICCVIGTIVLIWMGVLS